MEDSRVEVSSLGLGACGGRGDATEDRGWREEKRGYARRKRKRERGKDKERVREGEREIGGQGVVVVKRTVHHWAQERKHCTLSANKPGFVVISSCGARVEPAQHTDA